MKIHSIFLLLAVSSVHCFPQSSADSAVDSFLNRIKVNVKKENDEENFMKDAIRGELCNRECKMNDKKVCRFKFMIKFYQVMSG